MKPLSHFITWAFVIAFIIITNLFIYYSIGLVAQPPKYEDFCSIRNEVPTSAEMCVVQGGQWTNFSLSPKEVTEAIKNENPLGWCDAEFTCRQEFETKQSNYNKNVFIVMIGISIALFTAGIFITFEVLSLALVWTGVSTLLVATIRFWSDAGDGIKVLILGIGIIALIWLAVKKMKN